MSISPFLKHPVLQNVGYELMKQPNFDGIKAELGKRRKRDLKRIKYFYIYTTLVVVFGLFNMSIGDKINVMIGIVWIILGRFSLIYFQIEKNNNK